MTDDELTILTIAGTGESMMAIGRWKPAVEQLALLGLLKKLDPFNYVITLRGKAVLKDKNHEQDETFKHAYQDYNNTQNHRQQMLESSEQAAVNLSHAARAAVRLTGRPANQAVWEISQQVLQRALELLEKTADDRPH